MSEGTKTEAERNLQYFPELDYLRGLAILAVITIHITTYYTRMPATSNLKILYMVLIVLARFGVPVFLLVSGFVLYNKYNTNFNLREFYVKRFLSIIPAYVVFSVLYEKWNRGAITAKFINDLLTGGANQHLWFIILIVEFYIAYPVIMQIYNYTKNHGATKYFLALAFFINVINVYVPSYGLILMLFDWLFYFVLGIFIRDNYKSIKIKISRKFWLLMVVIICIGTALSVIELENTYFSTSLLSNFQNIGLFHQLLYILNCTALTLLIFYITMNLYNTRKASFFSIVGSYSFGIYLVHAYIVVVVVAYLQRLGVKLDNILFYPCAFIVTLIISMTAVVLLDRLPYHEYIIGKTGSIKSKVGEREELG